MRLLPILFSLFSVSAWGADCSPVDHVQGPRTCAAKSHPGQPDSPRKECQWSADEKVCTCCIYNEEAQDTGAEAAEPSSY